MKNNFLVGNGSFMMHSINWRRRIKVAMPYQVITHTNIRFNQLIKWPGMGCQFCLSEKNFSPRRLTYTLCTHKNGANTGWKKYENALKMKVSITIAMFTIESPLPYDAVLLLGHFFNFCHISCFEWECDAFYVGNITASTKATAASVMAQSIVCLYATIQRLFTAMILR